MSVIQVGGAGEEIGKALAALGAGVSQVAYPHQDIQKAVKQMIATNPKALHELAAGFRDNPDMLHKLVGKDIATKILATPKDFNESYAEANLGTLSGMLSDPKKLAAFRTFNEAKIMGADNPVAAVTQPALADTIQKRLSSPEGVGLIDRAADQTITGQTKYQRDLDDRKGELLGHAMKYISNDKDVDIHSAYEIFNNYFDPEKIKLQQDLWDAHNAKLYQQSINKIDTQNAIDSWQASKVGTVDAWHAVLTNRDGAADIASRLAGRPDLAKTPQEKEYAAVGDYLLRRSSVDKAKDLATIGNRIDKLKAILNNQDKIKPVNDEERTKYLSDLNQQLMLGKLSGGEEIHAELRGWGGSKFRQRVVFKGSGSSDEIPDDQIRDRVTSPEMVKVPKEKTGTPSPVKPAVENNHPSPDMNKLSSQARQAFGRYSSAQDKAAEAKDMKQYAPTIYNELKSNGLVP